MINLTTSYPFTALWCSIFSVIAQDEPRHEGNSALDSLKANPHWNRGDRLPGRKRSQNTNLVTNRFQIAVGALEGNRSFSYDANGNCLSDGQRTYQWDAANRLVGVTQGTNTYAFGYDYAGRRVSEKLNGALIKQSVWDGATLAEERNGSNAVTKRFFGQGETQSGVPYYYLRDHLGSVRELVNATGSVQAEYSYDPYGNVTTNQVSGTSTATFQYAGYYAHQGMGLDLTLYRAYDPDTGRWLSRDPIGENGGINIYGYVQNSPLNWNDPYGLYPFQSIGRVNIDGDYNYGPSSAHGDSTTQHTLPAGAHANSDLDNYVASTPAARKAGVKIGDPAIFNANGKSVQCTVQDSRMHPGVEVSRKAALNAGLTPTEGNGVKLNGRSGDIQGTITYPNTPAPKKP